MKNTVTQGSKGIWIPEEIMPVQELNWMQKVIWAYAHFLPNGLRMSDEELGRRCCCSPTNAKTQRDKMVKMGWLKKNGCGKNRQFVAVVKNNWSNMTNSNGQKQPSDWSNMTNPTGQKRPHRTYTEHTKEHSLENKGSSTLKEVSSLENIEVGSQGSPSAPSASLVKVHPDDIMDFIERTGRLTAEIRPSDYDSIRDGTYDDVPF